VEINQPDNMDEKMQRIEEGKCFPGNKIEDHGCSIEIEETRTA